MEVNNRKLRKLTPRQSTYCGSSIEQEGTQLSLDHLKCHTHGGDNSSSNLVTCCTRCNSSRGSRSVASFCRAVAAYLDLGADPKQIERHVWACAKRALPLAEAREILERRGGITNALAEKKGI